MLEKLHRIQVLISAIQIRHPLAGPLAMVQVKHPGDILHPQAIGMINLRPEERIGNQEIRHLRSCIIIGERAVIGIQRLARIQVLIQVRPVKTHQSVLIP